MLRILSFLILTLAAACGDAVDAPRAAETPAAETREAPAAIFAKAEARLAEEVDAGKRSGFVAAVIHDGETQWEAAIGLADRESGTPMTAETGFRIASMTKPIATVGLLMLVEEGAVALDDPASDYIPALADMRVATSTAANADGGFDTVPLARPITVRDLLTHMAGIGYLFDFETDLGRLYLRENLYAMDGDLDARIAALAKLPLYDQPGTVWRYSYGTDVIGAIIEIASGQPLDEFLRVRIFAPLGMDRTEFFLSDIDFSRLAVVYAFNEEGEMVRFDGGGLVADPNTQGAGFLSAGGGLVSTLGDYLRFMQMLLNRGALDGARILEAETVEAMAAPQIPDGALPESLSGAGLSFGYGGWVVVDPESEYAPPGSFGWGGYYDTRFGISLADNLGFIVMTQREPGPSAPASAAEDIVREAAFKAFAAGEAE